MNAGQNFSYVLRVSIKQSKIQKLRKMTKLFFPHYGQMFKKNFLKNFEISQYLRLPKKKKEKIGVFTNISDTQNFIYAQC